jgi:hypothetical protein
MNLPHSTRLNSRGASACTADNLLLLLQEQELSKVWYVFQADPVSMASKPPTHRKCVQTQAKAVRLLMLAALSATNTSSK